MAGDVFASLPVELSVADTDAAFIRNEVVILARTEPVLLWRGSWYSRHSGMGWARCTRAVLTAGHSAVASWAGRQATEDAREFLAETLSVGPLRHWRLVNRGGTYYYEPPDRERPRDR